MAKKWVKVKDRTRNGKKTGVVISNTTSGETKVLLNPHGKYLKYDKELKDGVRYTNNGEVKKDKKGNPMHLTKAQRIYRQSYKTAIIDQAKAYNGRKKK